MVKSQLIARDIKDKNVLDAMGKVPRHNFVPENIRHLSYNDTPLPIGLNQTISQPYIVAFMTEAAKLNKTDRVLEIGTGSGYQAAILAELVKEVYTIEILEPLLESAKKTITELGYENIFIKLGDGHKGWKEKAPFDAIIVTAAPKEIPQELIAQLKENGRMIIPVGDFYQELKRITKTGKTLKEEKLIAVRFVPMTGSPSIKE